MTFNLSDEQPDKLNKEENRKKEIATFFRAINSDNIYFICMDVLFYATTIFIFETYQPKMMMCNIPVSFFGIIYFCFTIVTGAGAGMFKFFGKINKKPLQYSLKHYFIIAILQAATATSLYILPSDAIIVLSIFMVQELIFGYFNVYTNAAINSRISNSYRATIISIKSLLSSGFKSVIFICLGNVMEVYSLRMTYISTAVLLVAGSILICGVAKIHKYN